MPEIPPGPVGKLEEVIERMQAEGSAFGTVLDADFQPSLG
jgi:hypothetical protein